ncbi:MAG: hydroxyacid dehydrogenase [Deltaproteobacteria bacterium]|nr:hydroxyacid dehydrogenase [Deltaproteobacteria bacterium]
MMADKEKFFVPVIFADRFFMSANALADITLQGGYAWADAKDHFDLAEKLTGSPFVRVIVSEYIKINSLILEQAPGLKGVIAYGAGYDHIDVDFFTSREIFVCNCRGENAQAVAELTFALLLSLMRRIHLADHFIRENAWKRTDSAALPEWIMGRELWGKTLGIIGLGQIGSRVARIARGFDMRILSYDPFAQIKEGLGVESAALEDILSNADIISLHVPLTAETEKMVNARALSLLKPKAVLVNTSRGKIIDEPALIKALEQGRIGGAALDVFSKEPIPSGHPFFRMKNVVLSPHMGALTQEAGERLSDAVVRQVRDIMNGRRPECLIKISEAISSQ